MNDLYIIDMVTIVTQTTFLGHGSAVLGFKWEE